MKKFLVFILVLTMVIGTSAMVFAEPTSPASMTKVPFKKVVNGANNPFEAFNFTIGDAELESGAASTSPDFNPKTFDIEVLMGEDDGTKEINLPNYDKPGTYKYEIKETVTDKTIGMTYDTTSKYLYVLVVREDGELKSYPYFKDAEGKKQDFVAATNTYESGSLNITKEIKGNFANMDEIFEVEVVLEREAGSSDIFRKDGIEYGTTKSKVEAEDKVTLVYEVGNGTDFTITGIPKGIAYTVKEINPGDYTVKYNDNEELNDVSNTMGTSIDKVEILNTRTADIDTGISLDNLPYIMTLVLALGGLVLFVVRKRRFN